MGEAVDVTALSAGEQTFKARLKDETKRLLQLFNRREFAYSQVAKIGVELEGWLVDGDGLPAPVNTEFLARSRHDSIVEELSKFNFEINSSPFSLGTSCLSKLYDELTGLWQHSEAAARAVGAEALLIGIHPMVRETMLHAGYLSDAERYRVLNDRILAQRGHRPAVIDIKGREHLQLTIDDILIEAATTSLQIHLQANQEGFARLYNAAQIASAAAVAVAANSPYLYGYDLWAETRIPVFEQAVALHPFKDKHGDKVGRVTFGTGYVRHSAMELFVANLDGYPPLLPMLFSEPAERLRHLRLHNGTIWRWNRPIVDVDAAGEPHLRIEHRPMAAGPTLVDTLANVTFYLGMVYGLAHEDRPPEESMTFTDCKRNFYAAAKDGLNAKLRWFGKGQGLDRVILDQLIPLARRGLARAGVENTEVYRYLDDIIKPRVLSGQNGAAWQRAFIATHGKDFQLMTKAYLRHQQTGLPVHRWQV